MIAKQAYPQNMFSSFNEYPLISPTVTAVGWTMLVCSVALLILAVPSQKRLRTLTVSLAVSILCGASAFLVLTQLFRIETEELDPLTFIAGSLTVAGVILGVWAIASSWHRIWALFPAIAALVGTSLVANQFYAIYPDVSALEGITPYREASIESLPKHPSIPLEQWHPKALQPVSVLGTVVTATPDTPRSGFSPRESKVYLPPAWFTDPRPQLPVLVLMHGIPGSTDQWFTQGNIGRLAHDYQRTHGGLAPIIVTADSTGGVFKDPVCMDSPKANIRSFLTQDLPEWIIQQFDATADRKAWTLGGLSYGGTCSFQTVTNNPESYGNFLDFSGERTPNDGVSHASTVKDFFGGSESKFQAQNPEDLLLTKRFEGTRGVFAVGSDERDTIKDLQLLNDLALQAGMESRFIVVGGNHSFETWRAAMKEVFPEVISWSNLQP